MAIPTIAAAELQTIGSTGSSTSVAAPSGMTTGHLDLIWVSLRTSAVNKTIATPSGFTQAFQGALSSANQTKIAAFWRAAEASPGSATIQLADGADIARAGIVRMRIDGADLTAPIDVQAGALTEGTAAPSTSPTFTNPGLTTTVNDCLAITGGWWGSSYLAGSNGSRYSISGWTAGAMNHCIPSAGNASNPSAWIASKGIATAGSTGSAVADPADHANTDAQPWISFMLAIAPAAGGPPPAIVRPRVVIF